MSGCRDQAAYVRAMPVGCALEVCLDEAGAVVHVSGQSCRRGTEFARQEAVSPGSSADFDSSRPGRPRTSEREDNCADTARPDPRRSRSDPPPFPATPDSRRSHPSNQHLRFRRRRCFD